MRGRGLGRGGGRGGGGGDKESKRYTPMNPCMYTGMMNFKCSSVFSTLSLSVLDFKKAFDLVDHLILQQRLIIFE